MNITIYGASDDLIEVQTDTGESHEHETWTGRANVHLRSPEGEYLDVALSFGDPVVPAHHADAGWSIAVASLGSNPDWPIRFSTRPDLAGDPAVTICAPDGTRVMFLDGE